MKRPKNTDIILVVLLSVISIICITIPSLNKYIIVLIPYGLLLFFLPGYSIVTALSIKKSGLITKILVGILISMVITFILISTIHYTNTPFRYRLIIIALFTILFAAVGYIRRVIASRKPDRYVICESCNGYYKLEEGESLEDFEACRCGGELRYAEDNFMSKKEPKRKKKSHKEKKSKKPKAEDPQYIVCENCGGHYTLKKGESLEDFESCRCGGRLKYAEKYFKLNPKGRSKIFSNSFLLVIILTLAAVIAVVFNSISGSIARSIMVLPLLFFLSGYSIINIIHPHLSKFKLAISSFILSTAVTFLLCLAFSSIVKISPANVITALACLTIILTVFSKIRDPKLSKAEKEGEEKKVQKRSNLGTALLKSIAVRNKQSTSPTENSVSALPKSPQKAPHDKKPVFKLPEESRIAIPSDIILVWLITALCVISVLIPQLETTVLKSVFGFLLILFVSGYALISFIYPRKESLECIERFALSFGLSLVITSIIGFTVYSQLGTQINYIFLVVSILTIILSFLAYIRRLNLQEEDRFNVNFKYYFNRIVESFKGESKKDKVLSIILAVSIILAISATAYVIAVPKEGEKFTEFYILGPDGKASNYPTNLTVGQTGNVTVGIVNHEYSTVNYEMIIKLNNQTINDTNITLSNNETWQQPFTFTPSSYGQNQELEFLLYKLPDNNTVYRSLHLWVNVG
jgi:uncharacterized membrane protein